MKPQAPYLWHCLSRRCGLKLCKQINIHFLYTEPEKDGISFIIDKLFWSKEWMMQTHNILTELNEARCPGQLRCWSLAWPGPGLHLDDSEHSDNLRSSGGGIRNLSWNQTLEKVSQKIGSLTNSRKSSLSVFILLVPFIITIICAQLTTKIWKFLMSTQYTHNKVWSEQICIRQSRRRFS